MDDQAPDTASRPRHGGDPDPRSEPVRTRWTPKPEQILILESIFNSGMVNPPKEETVRIRKLLEKFGAVGDANVFYWFQNRRSRSRRRQRQIQASLSGGEPLPPRAAGIPYENIVAGAFAPNSLAFPSPNCAAGSSSASNCGLDRSSDGFFSFSGHNSALIAPDYLQNPVFCSADSPCLPYQSEVMTVFINGVATEVGRGHVDMKAMFGGVGGGEYMLYHSSGIPVEVNEYGFLVQGLQHGESYFLVSRHS